MVNSFLTEIRRFGDSEISLDSLMPPPSGEPSGTIKKGVGFREFLWEKPEVWMVEA